LVFSESGRGGNPSPLPLLDKFEVGLLDENSDPSERLAPPITQRRDSRIDQLGESPLPFLPFEPLMLVFTVFVASFMVVVVRPSLHYCLGTYS
jgi:hypothetical protein